MENIYQESIIAYVDILGASNLMRDPSPETADLLLQIFTFAKRNESSSSTFNCTDHGNGRIDISVTPVISVFSDHIVFSFSVENEEEKIGYFINEIIARIQDYIYKLILRGLLLRGAIVIGKLYHKNGVIFGPALVNAAQLEKEANYPRILIADEVITKYENPSYWFDRWLSQDREGRKYLNIPEIWKGVIVEDDVGSPQGYVDIHRIQEIVTDEICAIKSRTGRHGNQSDEEREKILKKWEWFLESLSNCAGGYEPPTTQTITVHQE